MRWRGPPALAPPPGAVAAQSSPPSPAQSPKRESSVVNPKCFFSGSVIDFLLFRSFFAYFFGGLECVGHSFAYVAQFVYKMGFLDYFYSRSGSCFRSSMNAEKSHFIPKM